MNAINKGCKKIILDKQAKNAAAERNNVSDTMRDLLDDDHKEVDGVITTLLPVLNTTELEEAKDNNDRPKGRTPKNTTSKKIRCLNLAATAFINEVAAKCDKEKKNCVKKVRRGRFNKLFKEACALRNVPSNIENETIDLCIQCRNLVLSSTNSGSESHLAPSSPILQRR